MPIAEEDGFFQTHDMAHTTCLGIESDRIPACVERIRQTQTRGVFGSPFFGFHGKNVDFLRELPWVEAVWFWDVCLNDIEGLYSLENLLYFGVHPKRPPIDFSRFPKLKRASIEPKTKDRGLDELKELERLNIGHFRPAERAYSSLKLPESLRELEINWASPESLDSLPALPNLRRLVVTHCRNLADLGSLNEKYPNLEYLVVDACGRITAAEGGRAIQGLHKLAHAFVGNKKLV